MVTFSLAYIPVDSVNRPSVAISPSPTTAKEPGRLPGLNPADVTISLKERGFECTQAVPGTSGYTWTCKAKAVAYYYQVDIYSRELSRVDTIYATAIRYDSQQERVIPFLGFIATVPYDGARPDEARRWVAQAIKSEARAVHFGKILYRLSNTGQSTNLTIGGDD